MKERTSRQATNRSYLVQAQQNYERFVDARMDGWMDERQRRKTSTTAVNVRALSSCVVVDLHVVVPRFVRGQRLHNLFCIFRVEVSLLE